MTLGERHRQERMCQRFQKVGIVVDDEQSESDEGIQIFREDEFSCVASIYGIGKVYYVLSLRLISDSPHRVIEQFAVETDREPIGVLDRGQRFPSQYINCGPEAELLNDRIGQRFGPTLCKKGLLLGQGMYSPVANRKQRWTSITVSVLDQFGKWYEQAVPINVHDFSPKDERNMTAKVQRKSVFAAEDDEPAAVQLGGGHEWSHCAPARHQQEQGECGRKK